MALAEMERMACAMAKSKLFGMKTPEEVLSLMLIAQAEGLHPAIAARDYDIIQGRPAKKSQAMFRSFLEAGGKVEWHAVTDQKCDATFSHPQGGSARIDWTIERAKTAGLTGKDNWRKFPRQMLRARVISEGVQTVFPGAASGMYVPEEVQDFDDRREAKAVGREIRSLPPDPTADGAIDSLRNADIGELVDRTVSNVQGVASAFTGASRPAKEAPTKTPQADALLPSAEEPKRAKDAWKDDRAIELGWPDRRTQTAAVMGYQDDAKGFSITAAWTAPRLEKLGRKTLWGLKPDELAELHDELRKAGDAGERFKKTGPAETAPPEFAPLPDDGVPF